MQLMTHLMPPTSGLVSGEISSLAAVSVLCTRAEMSVDQLVIQVCGFSAAVKSRSRRLSSRCTKPAP